MKLNRFLRTALKLFVLTRGFRAARRGVGRYGGRRVRGGVVQQLMRRLLR
ncbi:hypothetical protein [Truepera radiovictrix]|uniref:Uncharacterized protein n=1 Tax=Truepera radiovictrix (strain DSM 17093 / CIP 108686 / LMG 22925 / RQ-24) TaxID=649638 RepID=D7CTT2_TRURR|nr:hypothetical protein [Truepera radiovictrix]ADI15629.1 hypothetical protein Trad_2523 [Truepera radiovictrix DSM 17093]WMT58741.1 hypothetical protein RCV51_07290 [Truepera radiovictrix]